VVEGSAVVVPAVSLRTAVSIRMLSSTHRTNGPVGVVIGLKHVTTPQRADEVRTVTTGSALTCETVPVAMTSPKLGTVLYSQPAPAFVMQRSNNSGQCFVQRGGGYAASIRAWPDSVS
jgi:hypothetical protein